MRFLRGRRSTVSDCDKLRSERWQGDGWQFLPENQTVFFPPIVPKWAGRGNAEVLSLTHTIDIRKSYGIQSCMPHVIVVFHRDFWHEPLQCHRSARGRNEFLWDEAWLCHLSGRRFGKLHLRTGRIFSLYQTQNNWRLCHFLAWYRDKPIPWRFQSCCHPEWRHEPYLVFFQKVQSYSFSHLDTHPTQRSIRCRLWGYLWVLSLMAPIWPCRLRKRVQQQRLRYNNIRFPIIEFSG